MVSRAEALRDLLGRVEADEASIVAMDLAVAAGLEFTSLWAAFANGSLDAVARLEAPLRERGWRGPEIAPLLTGDWDAGWRSPGWPQRNCGAEASTEARARLLAVLNAMLLEAEASS